MTIFGVFITYACCWWLVLFMVLPWRVKIAEKPAAGLAASAPLNPMICKKMLITSVLAIVPTAFLYFYVSSARAAEPDIYSTHSATPSGCDVAHQPAADVQASGSDVSADGQRPVSAGVGDVYVGMDVPAGNYSDSQNPDLRHSDVYAGAVKVGQDGSVSYNGQVISTPPANNEPCK